MASRSSSTENHADQPTSREPSEPHRHGHHHTQHRSAQRRERLRRIEERHKELGRILQEAIGATDDAGNEPVADSFDSSDHAPPPPAQEGTEEGADHEWMDNPLERLNVSPQQPVAPHGGTSGSNANGKATRDDPRRRHQRYDLPLPTPASEPQRAAATTDDEAPQQAAALVGRLEDLVAAQAPHAAPADVMDHPIVRSLEAQVETLHEKYTSTEARLTAAQVKTEALARNLVKALRERNQFEEALLSRKNEATGAGTRNSTMDDMYSSAQGTSGGNVHEELQHTLRTKESELEQCYRELDRLVALGLRDRLRGEDRADQHPDEALQAQATSLQSDVKRVTAALQATEHQRDRLAAELRLSASCIETLDQRLLVSERELLQARLALAAAQASKEAAPRASDGALKDVDLSTVPLSVRKHIARLTAEASTLHERMQQMLTDEQHRGHFDRDLQAELRAHNSALEAQLATLLASLDDEIREHARTGEVAARDRQVLRRLQQHAELVSSTIATSRTDVDKVLELTTSLGMNDACASAVRRFGNQVSRDLAAMAQLLSSARAMSEPSGSTTDVTGPLQRGGGRREGSHSSSQGNDAVAQGTAHAARRGISSPSAKLEPPSSGVAPSRGEDAPPIATLAWRRALLPPSERSPSPSDPAPLPSGRR